MNFLFHSIFKKGARTKYFNVYKIDETHFLAECHHFNNKRFCDGDFEITKENDEWTSNNPEFAEEAQQLGEEIERVVKHE